MNPSVDQTNGAAEPQTWHRIVVVLLALVFFLTPYLFGERASDQDAVGAELVGDGLVLVTNHEALREAQANPSLGTLTQSLKTSWWGSITGGQSLYRPIPTLLLATAGAAGGPYDESEPGDKTFPYHVIVLALNVLCSLLVLELAWLVFKNAKAALVSGALFATLPIHGEVIYDVAGVAELSATAFSLAAWAAWIRAGDKPLARPAHLGVSLLCLFLASLSKESAFVLPLVFFLFDLRGGEGGIGAGFEHALSKLPALFACAAVLGVSLALRMTVVGELLPQYVRQNELDNPLLFEGFVTRFMNALRVLAGGTAAVFGINPLSSNWNYSPDYSMSQIPVLAPFALWNLAGAAFVLGAIAVAVLLYRNCRTRAALVLAFFGATLITSNLILPVGTIYGDRLMFFPSVAAVMFLAAFLGKRGTLGVAIGLLLAVGGGYWNWQNGRDHWTSQTELWQYAKRQAAPGSARVHYNNAIDAASDQVFQLARTDLEQAIEIYPRYAQALARLGDLHTLSQEFDLDRAIELFERACEVQLEDYQYDYPREPLVGTESFGPRAMLFRLTRLRVFQDEVAEPERHLEWLDGLIAEGYDAAYVHHRRGDTLAKLGRLDEAEEAYAKSLRIEATPDAAQAYGLLLQNLGRTEDALAVYRGITRFNTDLEKVAILLARGEAELEESPSDALATADELWEMRGELAREGKGRFSPRQEFETLFLRARAKYALWGPNPTPAQNEELIKILRNAVGAVRPGPDTYDASALLTQLLIAQGRYEEARPVLEALIVTRESPSLRYQLGAVYHRLGRLEDALDQYNRIDSNLVLAAEIAPEFFENPQEMRNVLLSTRASVLAIYAELDREDEAYATIDGWHDAAEGAYDPDALAVHAAWELSKGELLDANEIVSTFQTEFPQDPRGSELESTLTKLQELDRRASDGDDALAAEQLAAMRRRLFDYPGALEMAVLAVELSEGGPVLDLARRLALLAAIQEDLGNLQLAIDANERGLELGLGDENEQVFAAEIERLRKRLAG